MMAIDEFYNGNTFGSDTMISRTKIVTYLRSLLEVEMEQIETAYGDGIRTPLPIDVSPIDCGKQYFTQTFKSE